MNGLHKRSSKEFFNLNSWNSYCDSVKYFESLFQQFHETTQSIFEHYFDFISEEIDRHFDGHLEKIEKSLEKFDKSILNDLELIGNRWTCNNVDDLNLEQLLEAMNLINVDFIALEEKTSYLVEKINTFFSALCQEPRLKFSEQNLVRIYDIQEVPSPDIKRALNVEPKRSSSFLNAKPLDAYINQIKNNSFSNSVIALEPLGSDYRLKLISIYEKIVDRLPIDIDRDLVANIYTIDIDNKLDCLLFDQNNLIDAISSDDEILKLKIFDIKVLDNGHLITAEENNTLSIWDISHAKVKRIKRIIPRYSDNVISCQLRIKKLAENKFIFYLRGKINLVVRKNDTYNIEKRFSLNWPCETKISILKYSETLGIALVKENSDLVELWCLNSASLKTILSGHAGYVQAAAFLSENQLITGSNLDQVIVRNFSKDGNVTKQFEYSDQYYLDSIVKIKILHENRKIVTLNDKNKIIVFDFELKLIYKISDEFQAGFSVIKPICLTKNELIHLDGSNGCIQVYDIENGQLCGHFRDKGCEYNLFEEMNGEVITVSTDGIISKWTVNPNFKICCFQLPQSLKKIKCFDPLKGNNKIPKKPSVTYVRLTREKNRRSYQKFLRQNSQNFLQIN